MKTLIVEDDLTSRLVLQEFVKEYGTYRIAVNGSEAVEAVRVALDMRQPYDLICLDIMLPEMNGQMVLERIRSMEKSAGITEADHMKIVMTTCLADKDNVIKAVGLQCDRFLVKPIHRDKFVETLHALNLVPEREEPAEKTP
jgi:two-component system, chemotaxis family, chemotaxis protein CheY